MYLDRRVRHPRQHFGGVDLGGRNFPVRGQAAVQPLRRAQGEQIGGVYLSDHVGDLKADALELADLLAELLAVRRVLQGDVEGPARATDAHGRDSDARCVKPFVHHREAAIDFPQHLRIGQAAVVKLQHHVLVTPVRDGVVAVADGEAGMAAIHQKRRDPLFRPLGRVVLACGDEDDDEIRVVGAGNEVFGPVHHPVAAVAARKAFHPPNVGPGVRFGHRQRVHPLPPHGGEEVAFDLLAFAGHQDVLRAAKEMVERH